jgi:hypothetical protein
MTFVCRLFLFALLSVASFSQAAFARLPEKPAERSLLYWRYLCRDEAQEEIIQNGEREFKCVTQNWVVKTAETNGIVKEIIDESP